MRGQVKGFMAPRGRERRAATIGLASFVGGFLAGPALPCSDYVPEPTYSLIQDGWGDQVPFLAPSNDSRTNLLLLLADTRRTHPRFPPRVATDWPPRPLVPHDRYAGQTPFSFDTLAAAFDDHPRKPDAPGTLMQGEGDRCRSNAAGAGGFLAALKASSASADEKAYLTTARNALGKACDSGAKAAVVDLPATIRSADGKAFGAYLTAAARFYTGDFAGARQGFAGLANSAQPWLKETSRYMVARVDLNAAEEKAFNIYGGIALGQIDTPALAKVAGELESYEHDYPRGDYALSAHGLLRRVAWLGDDQARLARLYAEAFTRPYPKLSNISNIELVDEIDNKLITSDVKPSNVHEPKLLAVLDLMRMRGGYGTQPFGKTELDMQAPAFAGQMTLYGYLRAVHAFYVEKDPAAALKILGGGKARAHMSYLAFSAQVLKGLALEALHRPAAARAQWLTLIPLAEPVLQRPAVELALAQNYERAGEVAAVFAAASPIHDPSYREVLLTHSASPELLRQQATAADAPAHERQLALYVLLFKELSRGRYPAFLDDLRLTPDPAPAAIRYEKLGIGGTSTPALADFTRFGGTHDGYTCPAIAAVATSLAANPHDEGALICLGEFVRLNGYEDFLRQDNPPAKPGTTPAPAGLSSTATQFPGIGVSRMAIYKTIIADPKAAYDVRAYALYRAVRCFAPAGYNECDETQVPQSQRQDWYRQLKTRYRGTTWANRLKFYW